MSLPKPSNIKGKGSKGKSSEFAGILKVCNPIDTLVISEVPTARMNELIVIHDIMYDHDDDDECDHGIHDHHHDDASCSGNSGVSKLNHGASCSGNSGVSKLNHGASCSGNTVKENLAK